MKSARRIATKGVEEARKSLPAILDAAAQGQVTIITRRGSAIAAVVPAGGAARPTSLLSLAGTGKGLWGRHSGSTLARLRDEWKS